VRVKNFRQKSSFAMGQILDRSTRLSIHGLDQHLSCMQSSEVDMNFLSDKMKPHSRQERHFLNAGNKGVDESA